MVNWMELDSKFIETSDSISYKNVITFTNIISLSIYFN